MKSKLIILTDLWGLKNAAWLEKYYDLLKSDFEVIIYDSSKLAGIENDSLSEKELHSLFINAGIRTATENLIRLEKNPIDILGFSVGGTIAWQAGLNGLQIKNLYAISSTRLRYETKKPICKINLVFGENDAFQPSKIWAENLKLNVEIYKNGEHEFYKEDKFIEYLCELIKTQHSKVD